MSNIDPLQNFERLAAQLRDVPMPPTDVTRHVLRRIHTIQTSSDKIFTYFALGSGLIAATVLLVGVFALGNVSNSLTEFFEIVPPIGL